MQVMEIFMAFNVGIFDVEKY